MFTSAHNAMEKFGLHLAITLPKSTGLRPLSSERKAMKHHKYHQHYQVRAAKLHARAEAALDLITALVIGIGLAACLFYGWSA
jgi:hypothetical protein